MLYMLYNERSISIRIDLMVGNKFSGCLIIILELKLGFVRVWTMIWILVKVWCVLDMAKDVLCIFNDVLEF